MNAYLVFVALAVVTSNSVCHAASSYNRWWIVFPIVGSALTFVFWVVFMICLCKKKNQARKINQHGQIIAYGYNPQYPYQAGNQPGNQIRFQPNYPPGPNQPYPAANNTPMPPYTASSMVPPPPSYSSVNNGFDPENPRPVISESAHKNINQMAASKNKNKP